MRWLKTIANEIYGLFVDDLGFALAILLWLGVAWLFPHSLLRNVIAAGLQGVLLAAGLVAILVESVLRAAARSAVNRS